MSVFSPGWTIEMMKPASWTYELPATGAASEGLEDYEIRTADDGHIGVGLGLVAKEDESFLLVDMGAMPPLIHRRIAVPWRHVLEVDHAALSVRLSVDRDGLDEVALALDPKLAVHGPGADAARVDLPDQLTHTAAPGAEGPMDKNSAIALALLAAAAPFSLFVVSATWIARGLGGWEYALLALPFVLAALTVALEGYRLFREPHAGHYLRRRGSRSTAPQGVARGPFGG